MSMRLSVLDLAPIAPEEGAAASFRGSVALAQAAERGGFERVWYAEHHNMPSIASSATAVVIAHVASQTSTIRLGAGGVMLPNHAPLVIAEQFGTLETLHPGRIDLGLGRAPGTDQTTFRALRRDIRSSERFPEDVLELQGYLAGRSVVDGVAATPGAGTNVPLFILGSSLFGATLAARLGLPYAFASHFAPDQLHEAVAVYRDRFEPSEQLDAPYVIVGANATIAPTTAEAESMHEAVRRHRARAFLTRGLPPGTSLGDDELDMLMSTSQGKQILMMLRVSAVGTGEDALAWLTRFGADSRADEVMVGFHGRDAAERVRGLELLAAAR